MSTKPPEIHPPSKLPIPATTDEKMQLQRSPELQTSAAIARVQQEIQAAIIVARQNPRDEDVARAKLLRSCQRSEFAEDVQYSFKRGSRMDENGKWVDNYVTGPSVYFAREAGRLWGNIKYGFKIIRDDADTRQIECYAWDLETNTHPTEEKVFRKLIWRKDKKDPAGGKWVTPDERDLAELTNSQAAKGYRNCILAILPSDLISESQRVAATTLKDAAKNDPDGQRKRIIDAFASLNIMPDRLTEILGHKLSEASPDEIARLRGIYQSVKEGNTTIQDHLKKSDDKGESKPADDAPNEEELKFIAEAVELMKHDAIDFNKAQREAKIAQYKGRLPELIAELKAQIAKATTKPETQQQSQTEEPKLAEKPTGNGKPQNAFSF